MMPKVSITLLQRARQGCKVRIGKMHCDVASAKRAEAQVLHGHPPLKGQSGRFCANRSGTAVMPSLFKRRLSFFVSLRADF